MKQAASAICFLAFTLSSLFSLPHAFAQSQEEQIDPYAKWLKEDVF